MTSRTLAITNLVGCLVLGAVLVVQWRHELSQKETLVETRRHLAEAETAHATEKNRADGFERDIVLLKESIDSLGRESEQIQTELSEARAASSRLVTDLETAHETLEEWKKAIDERDERIAELNARLTATRQRLDEAIARLKNAAAQR